MDPIILIVDDELIIRETLGSLLENNYEVHMAKNGEEGLRMAENIHPDVILLDVMMPGITGFEVCRQMRMTPGLEEVVILMVTALDDQDSRLMGLRAGADDFLNKPFDHYEIQARIQTITRLNRYRRLMEQRKELEKLHQDLLNSYEKTIEGWVNALDLRDKETEGHTQRVCQMSVEFARELGVREEQLTQVRMGALLHDIGKLGVPDAILFKKGKLNKQEWETMRKHPVYAYEWLAPISYLKDAIVIPHCHHEKWDGSGYPRGLRGEEIPLYARLFAIIDVWDALSSKRVYRDAMPMEEVMAYIKQQAGSHFDPQLVEKFIGMLKAKGVLQGCW